MSSPSSSIAVAWAGGIGSMLALEDALRAREDVVLVHVPAERAPPDFVLEEQAAALGLRLVVAAPASASAGEIPAIADALRDAKVERVDFGYLRGEEHAGMFALSRAARETGVEPALPVRHLRPDEAARQLAESGHRAFVHRVASGVARAWLGRFLDSAAVDEFEAQYGRSGWVGLRTLVMDGPRFARSLAATAGEPEATPEGGWRFPLGLRGC